MDRHSLIAFGQRTPRPGAAARSDRRAELTLGAFGVCVLAIVAGMVVTVAIKSWPSFSHNGLGWFGPGIETDASMRAMRDGIALPGHSIYYFRAWPLIWGTIVTTVPAVAIALVVSTLAAVFLTEFAPGGVQRTVEPIVRLLAGVPSIIYGLIGILALAPFIEHDFISNARKQSVIYVVQLNGNNISTGAVILAVMILPIMVAITMNALAVVPASWKEGSAALGVNRWRTIWRVSLRTARPAIVAGLTLATARALGEAVMLDLVSGSRDFAPNPLDGLTFFAEPARPLAATIFQESGGLNIGPLSHTLYAIAAVLLVSAVMLSLAGWAAKRSMARYGVV